jgi:hypothetical protein
MPWWRRILCIAIGSPMGLSGLFLLVEGSRRMVIPGAFLLGVGALLAFSGINPSATRDY